MSQRFDAFISYASEDNDAFVRPLTKILSKFGLNIWYDQINIKIGHSISASIENGLTKSSFGIIILSKRYFAKKWTKYELKGLFQNEIERRRTILPIWLNINKSDVLKISPYLADKKAIVSSGKNLGSIGIQIVEAIRPDIFEFIKLKAAYYESIKNSKPIKMKLTDIKMDKIRHNELPLWMVHNINLFRTILIGVYTTSIEDWIDGFKRDTHPEFEIMTWNYICSNYVEILNRIDSLQSKKRDVYLFLLNMVNGNNEVAARILSHNTANENKEIMKILKLNKQIVNFDDYHSKDKRFNALNHDRPRLRKALACK
jgi:hypothetical protein